MDYKVDIGGSTDEAAGNPICACCLEAIDQSWPVYTRMTLPGCQHCFHTVCLAQWLIQSHTCPLCRRAVEARQRELRQIREQRDVYDLGTYWTMEMVTAVQGLCGLGYRLVLLLAHDLSWSHTNVLIFDAIIAFNDALRWVFYVWLEYQLYSDALRYASISPVVKRYCSVLWHCAVAQLVAIIVYQVVGSAVATNTEWARAAECAVLLVACAVELVTQCATQCAWDQYLKRVTVDVVYVTTIDE